MIANERQYKISRSQAEKIQSALNLNNELALISDGIDPVIAAAHKAGLREQLRELDEAIARYEELQSGTVDALTANDFRSIGERLIEARVAKGLTQRELSDRLGIKEQQVQRYEQERYLSANAERLSQIADALELNVFVSLSLNPEVQLEGEGNVRIFEPSKLPIREMKKRGWLDDYAKNNPGAPTSDGARAFAFVAEAGGARGFAALHRKRVRTGSHLDEYALIAWQARVLQKARASLASMSEDPSAKLTVEHLSASFIKDLVAFSNAEDGPVKAISALRERGVIVIFERHLPGTHLDGAAMLLDGATPVIGLTLRHDRLDNFWFTLLHEVGHIVCHKDKGLREGFFDDSTVSSSEQIEAEADEFSENALIPTEAWKASFARYTNSPDQVVQFARKMNVGESVVAGRIRRERQAYHLFKNMIGLGCVRALISEAGLLG